MVTKYYEMLNLDKNPFSLTPDIEFYYLMNSHRVALDTVFFAFDNGSPMVRIYGEPGTGKTILLKYLESNFLEKGVKTISLTYNPVMDLDDFVRTILGEPVRYTSDIDRVLKDMSAKGRVAILIDEAQELTKDYFLFLKYILDKSNEEFRGQFFVVLAGTEKLKAIFSHPDFKPLAQRSPFVVVLEGLRKEEIASYVEHRLKKSGFSGEIPFKKGAVAQIWKFTKGNPRKVNILAERSILAAIVRGKVKVGKKEVKEAYKDISREIFE